MESSRRRALHAYTRAVAVVDPIRLQFWHGLGLTMAQLRIILLLNEQDGRTVGELARIMRVRSGTATELLDKVERQGLSYRFSDPDDRRLVRTSLTSNGRAVLGQISTASVAYLDAIFSLMSGEEVVRFAELLERFAEAADQVQTNSEWQT